MEPCTLRVAGVEFPKQEAWMIHRRGGAGGVALLDASFDGAVEKSCPHPWLVVLLGSPRRVLPEPLKESQSLINYIHAAHWPIIVNLPSFL